MRYVCDCELHHINPLTGNLMVLLDEWSEIYCDARAIAAISDEMDAGCYFGNDYRECEAQSQ